MARIFLFLMLFCFGCQTGMIPCPKAQKTRSQKFASRLNPSMITAEAQEENADQKSIRRNTHFRVKEVKNVSIEEWDCPKPGSRRYMPRSVKENIKKNLQKVNGGPDSTKVGFDHY